MKDGHCILSGQKLLYICSGENKKIMVKTIDQTNIVRVFWVFEFEISFLEEKYEEWSDVDFEKQRKECSGQWI